MSGSSTELKMSLSFKKKTNFPNGRIIWIHIQKLAPDCRNWFILTNVFGPPSGSSSGLVAAFCTNTTNL